MIRSLLVATSIVAAAGAFAPVALAQTQRPTAAQTAPVWIVDAKQSRIAFSTTWAGQKVAGQFGAWTADIRFDPANLGASRAIVTVTTGSARTGQKDPDTNLQDKDWFNPKAFPTARFETTTIRALGGDRYQADGRLTIRGVSVPVSLSFVLKIVGDAATMTGASKVDRLAFGMGRDSDPNAEWVDRTVTVDVAVRATRQK
jgi:cytochrome b561